MIYVCKNCGYTFWVKRMRCPKCGSVTLENVSIKEVEVIASWKLTATPEGFEDSYWLCLVKSNNAKLFCRSLTEPKDGGKLLLKDNGICEPLG
ncbi:zinc ribbon domain-containing protein [Sulfolobus tengchongensis]|uniref:Zinc ribbon domain-containing protein n=1 Tax=Sulfolobus tengchongensis TaxID=207809 RepID=A0AAX4L3C5_9CREN